MTRARLFALPFAALLLPLGGCIDVLDAQWFNGLAVDEYALPFNEIPEELLEFVELEGTATDDEGAPTLAGIWAHQPPLSAGQPNDPRRDITILYFHGNAENLDFYWDRVQILWRMGYPVFAIDYRGYGASTGTATEAGFYADGRTALDHTLSRLDDDDKLLVYGFSIGSTIAVDVATEFSPDLFVLEAALGSGQAFIDDTIGLGFQQGVLMDTEFDNLNKMPRVAGPKLHMHGENDTFVRFEFGEAVFEAAREPKRFLKTAGEHGTVPCPASDPGRPDEVPCLADEVYISTLDTFVAESLGISLSVPDDLDGQ